MTTVIATNDFHSEVAAAGALLARLRAGKNENAILIDAGDFFGGNAFHEFSTGETEERLLAELYDALVPGNHDLEDLARLRDPAAFPPVVCANLLPPDGFAGAWHAGLLFRRTRPKLGVVGWLGEQAFEAASPGERRGYRFRRPTPELLRAERDRLLDAGADLVLGVSHTGFEADADFQRTHGVFDLILSGHCHSDNYHRVDQAGPAATRHVVKAPELGRGAARIELDGDGGITVEIERFPSGPGASGAPGHPFGWLVAAIDRFRSWSQTAVGSFADPTDSRETIAERIAEAASAAAGNRAFALNLGAIRTGLPARVTRGALLDCAPFDSPLVVCRTDEPVPGLLRQLEALGEAMVCARPPSATPGLATTGYVAARLGLAADPLGPSHTIRHTISAMCEAD